MLSEQARYREANVMYRRASIAGGHDPHWRFEAAKLEWRLRRWPDAIESLEAVVIQRPDFADAHYRLGVAYLETRRFDDARASLARADALAPGNSLVQQARARVDELDRAGAGPNRSAGEDG